MTTHGKGEQLYGRHALCADSAGSFYLAARLSTGSGWTLATYRGSFTGSTFSWQRRSNAIPLLSYADPVGPDRLQLVCHPSGSVLYLVYIDVGAAESVKLVRSLNQGQTWSLPVTLSTGRSDHLRAVVGADGELYVIWMDEPSRRIVGRRSVDQGVGFGAPFVVSEVNYNHIQPAGWWGLSRDYPVCPHFGQPQLLSVAVDRSATASRGRLYVAWSEHAEGVPAPVSGGQGEVEPNGTPETATPVAIGQTLSGSMYGVEPDIGDCDWFSFEGTAGTTVWISGRLCGSTHGGTPLEGGQIGVWCGTDTAGLFPLGGTWFYCREECPAYVYTLPSTGRYYLDLGCAEHKSRGYSITLQELEVSAGSASRDHRDVVLVGSGDGGATWSSKARVNDAVGHDDALPAVAVDGRGNVHVAWYDRREEPECSATVHTRWSHSVDGGRSFAPSGRLSVEGVDLRFIRGAESYRPWVVGNYMALEAAGDEVHALWVEPQAVADPRNPPGGRYEPRADIWSAVIRDVPTSVVVAGFRAEAEAGWVRLGWELREAEGVRGFRLHRAAGAEEEYRLLGAVAARGAGPYASEDRGVEAGRGYRYRLEVETEGGSVWQGPVEAWPGAPAVALRWLGAAPNPFTERVVVELAGPLGGRAVVAVYDVTGHEVRRLHDGPLAGGAQRLSWDGRDRRGRTLPPGIYLIQAAAGGRAITRRVARIE